MRLKLDSVWSKMFRVEGKHLVAEASDLHGVNLFGRLYDDACDVGFNIRSVRTGRVVTYTLHTENIDKDGDYTSWSFIPTRESVREVPECENTVVTIFND